MDLFNFDNVKAEKTDAMMQFNRFRSFAKFFRLAEICAFFVFFSWISSHLPFAVKISGEYFRLFSGVIASHLFIFLLCNIIIIVLYINSCRFTGKSSQIGNAETEIYEEFLKNSTGDRVLPGSEDSPAPAPEEIVYQDKQIICEVNKKETDDQLRRSLSENLKIESPEMVCRKLQRSETENCRKISLSGGNDLVADMLKEDEMSNEEFQRTIEDFIAKQLRFRREESSAIVVKQS